MLTPRDTLPGTQAERIIRREFYKTYIPACLLNGEDRDKESALGIFTEPCIRILQQYLTPQALTTPVVLTDRLSNRVLAIHITGANNERLIAVNTRFRVDPDVLAHTLLEEYVHAQQVLDKVDFAAQRRQFAYAERPYEQEAKRIATEILGYDPTGFINFLRREEPAGLLYDRK